MHKSFAAALMLCSLCGTCHAQSESLLIGPGDLLQVDVLDTPEMEQQMRVSDTGAIPVAYIGDIHVAGMTPSSAAAAIRAMLIAKKVMRHPQVTVRAEEYATQDISVMGQVHKPGTYQVTTSQSIVKVLSLAGGLTDVADRHIMVRRHDSSQQVSYYLSNDPEVALSTMVIVNPGDSVLISRVPMIYVMGDVSRPGGYSIATNDSHLSLLQAISIAGSASKTSVKSHVRLLRMTPQGLVESPVQLDAIEKGKQPDISLQPNDIIYVPFSWIKNIALNSAAIVASTSSAAVYNLP